MSRIKITNLFNRYLLLACASVVVAPAKAMDSNEDLQAGQDAYLSGDLLTAMARFRSAADAGSAEAQAKLAWILDQSEDNEGAVSLYRKSAKQGHAAGEYGLGEMYAKGEGVEKDVVEALGWFTRAAEKGHLPALRVLISAYEQGQLGLAPDVDQAGRWLLRAAEALDRAAMKRLAGLYRTGGLGIDINEQIALQWEGRLTDLEAE